MLPGFFKTKSKSITRFEATEAFNHPARILNKLRDKEAELKKDAETNGSGSIDARKYHILYGIMKKIDKVINDFNVSTASSSSDEMNEIIQTTRKMLSIITNERREEETTLSTSRNHHRENVSNAVYYTTLGATYAVGTAVTAGTLGKLVTIFFVAPKVGKSVHKITGLDDLTPATLKLLDELLTELDHINAIFTKLSCANTEAKDTEYEDFICPISQDIIRNPVVCSLDGHAYERDQIEEWFKHSRRSPWNPREEIPPGKTGKDVLFTHYNYNSLLDKYRREHPAMPETKPSL